MGKTNKDLPVVFAACKRNSASVAGKVGQSSGDFPGLCGSRQAYKLPTPPGATFISLKCVKCGHSWTVPIGGEFRGV